MASIRERTLGDGSKAYLVQITRRKAGVSESRQFDKRKPAETWAKNREREIDEDIKARRKVRTRKEKRATLGQAIDAYIAGSRREMGRTKAQVLLTIRNEYEVSDMACDEITTKDIVRLAEELHQRPGLSSASTVMNYMSHLSSVFTHARVLYGYTLDQQAMKDAMVSLKHHGIAAKSASRDRRPTLDELNRLMEHFASASAFNPRSLPMHKVVAFALFSTRRQAEVCRIGWNDYDPDAQRVMVRKMKNPGDKDGLDTVVGLPDPCCAIIATMPRTKDRIFPFNSDTLSRRFTEACKVLEIDDLHFHDLRHEGASRLAEMGWSTYQIRHVTGHRSVASLDRYTHVRAIGDKYAGWEWIREVTSTE